MASTYSGNLAIELIGTGDQAGTWGNTTNTNLGTGLEQAIVGSSNITFSSANVALALAQNNAWQDARSLRLNLIGTVVNTQYLYVPAVSKQYIINNNLSNSIIISNGSNAAATGTAVTVPPGKTLVVYNTGSNIAETTNHVTNLSANVVTVTTFTAGNVTAGNISSTVLNASSATITTLIAGNASAGNLVLTNALPATSGGTGQSTVAVGDILVGAASNTLSKVTIGAANTVLTSNGTTAYWANVTSGGGYVTWATVQATNFNAVANTGYPVNTSGGAITATLPASPTYGQIILFTDYAGTFGTNGLTINRNGQKIFGLTNNFVLNITRSAIGFVFTDTTQGWIQYEGVDGSRLSQYSVSGLLVAGGGAGGGNGGGGAGGYVEFSGTSVTPGVSYVVTVGAGGSFNSGTGTGTNGGNTSFAGTSPSVTTAIGGGGGAGATGQAGGSGGGAGGTAGTGGAGTSGQGFRGGNSAATFSGSPGAGGGGASAAGADMNGGTTNGGNGRTWSVNATTYAGGGAGGAFNAGRGTGGSGGGGNGGGNGTAGTDGTAGLGGGGGGGFCQGNNGRNGGSGVAIIYYVGTQRASGGTVTSSGGFTFHTFTTTGNFVA